MTGQQLKNSILQMAVQGKLVPQDPNDEPAAVLLERIRAEKEQLIKEGKIKKEKKPSYIFRGADNLPYEKVGKNEPVCISDEVPFDIPESWEWVRLANICTKLVDGDHNPPKGESIQTSFIMASSTNINNDTLVDLEKVRFLSETVFIKENERTQASVGDIFFTSVGSLGRSCVYQGGLNICFQRSVSVITTLVYNYYLKYFFDSGYVQQKVFAEATGTAQKGFYLNQMAKLIVPVPPLSEQYRIVEEIRRILPLLTEYSKKEIEISALQSSFPDQLKKSILQEAVQGKLVPQDPNDEPASVLLERIRAEKQHLVQEGKIKKDKHESVIFRRDNSHYEIVDGEERCIDDEIPFELPENWVWARLGTSMINRDAERIPLSVNEREKLEKIYDYYGASGVIDKVDRYLFSKPLLLIGEDGANLLTRSKPIAFIARGQYWVNNHAHVLDSSDGLLLEYVAAYINAINLAPYVTGTAQPKMNQEKMNSILIPIPPTGEQLRIVRKINQIFPVIENM